jgi:hypothetical protein
LIFTGINPEEIKNIIPELKREIGQNLYYLIPVSSEMVDIGGASDLSNRIYNWQTNKCACERRGFYHPNVLHISPGGKARTCMYAIGSSDAGDISQKPFADVINGFPNRQNNDIFSNPNKNKQVFETLVMPYLSLYKPIIHECTRNVILAKTVEMYYSSDEPNLRGIHNAVANELNLTL